MFFIFGESVDLKRTVDMLTVGTCARLRARRKRLMNMIEMRAFQGTTDEYRYLYKLLKLVTNKLVQLVLTNTKIQITL